MKKAKAKPKRRKKPEAHITVTVTKPKAPPLKVVVPPAVIRKPGFWRGVARFFSDL